MLHKTTQGWALGTIPQDLMCMHQDSTPSSPSTHSSLHTVTYCLLPLLWHSFYSRIHHQQPLPVGVSVQQATHTPWLIASNFPRYETIFMDDATASHQHWCWGCHNSTSRPPYQLDNTVLQPSTLHHIRVLIIISVCHNDLGMLKESQPLTSAVVTSPLSLRRDLFISPGFEDFFSTVTLKFDFLPWNWSFLMNL